LRWRSFPNLRPRSSLTFEDFNKVVAASDAGNIFVP